MTRAQYEAHQRKHGFTIHQDPVVATVAKEFPSQVGNLMNKTEREFSFILEAQKRKGEISRWEFEGITLRWGGLRYTPDFVVFPTQTVETAYYITGTKFIETKGPFIRDDALVKFKAARAHWPEFRFELWQKAGGQWRQLF